ncbi:hypothetical protein QWZ13_04115 [Reinekea marina]|nr:hypothetical protein [Reinekea marina]MDN3648088.1 hypothetical protein [Reinekea marina]
MAGTPTSLSEGNPFAAEIFRFLGHLIIKQHQAYPAIRVQIGEMYE